MSRTDASLAVSLVVAAITLFSQPLKQFLDMVASIEDQYDLAFLPALTVLSVAFAITQSRKRVEAAAEARLSRAKSAELERLLTFGNALASSLDEEALQRAFANSCRRSSATAAIGCSLGGTKSGLRLPRPPRTAPSDLSNPRSSWRSRRCSA